MTDFLAGVVAVIGVLVLVFGLALLLAFPTMWAVNYLFSISLLTTIFGVAKLNFWRALVLNFVIGWFSTSKTGEKK
jgi:hypothetical protein